MADELLTVLLRIEANTKDARRELDALSGAEAKAGAAAKKMAADQESAFTRMSGGAQKFRAAIGGITGTVNAVKQSFGFLGDAADAFAEKNGAAGAAWKSASKEWDSALSKIQQQIGGVVVALSPLISALAKVVGLVSSIADAAGSGSGVSGLQGNAGFNAFLQREREKQAKNIALGVGLLFDDANAALAEGVQRALAFSASSQGLRAQQMARNAGVDAAARGPKRGGGSGRGGGWVDDYTGPRIGDSPISGYGHDYWGDEGAVGNFSGGLGANTGIATNVSIEQLLGAQGRTADAMAQFRGEQQDSKLGALFGFPASELELYAEGFNLLTGAMQGAFASWVDGSESAGEAIKGLVGDLLKGAATTMFGEAIKHGAWAIGDLAFGNLPGAALHGKAAAAFGAGALVVGGLARQYGGGGQSAGGASAGGGGGVPNYGGSGGGGGGGGNINVYVGDYFAEDNQRRRHGKVARAVRGAQRELESTGVRFT